MSAPALTAATTADLVGDPERLEVFVSVYGHDEHGRPQHKPLYHVWASSVESARRVIAEAPANAEIIYLRGPGVPERVWRDATSRAWRSK